MEHEQSQSWERHGDLPQGSGMSTKAAAAAAQEPPCNEEFAQGNRKKSLFIPQPFMDVPTNLSLSYSRAEPKQQQKIPPNNDLRGLGIDFFHTDFCF